jgi:hypothetical protein
MTPLDIIKAVKDYGTIAICVIGLVWFNNRSNEQDAKIERIELRLFDCFEERIKENTRINLFGREAVETSNVYAVIPEEIKIKRA